MYLYPGCDDPVSRALTPRQSRLSWRGVCLPPRAITQNANHAPAEPTIMTSTIGTALSPPEVARGAAMPLARDWKTPMTDEAVPACSRASLMAWAPELPKMNAFAVIMSAKPTHVGMSGRSRRNVETASVAEQLLALRAPGEHAASAPSAPESEGAIPEEEAPASCPEPSAPAGRVVLMGQILVDLAVRGDALPGPGGDVWAVDEGMHVGGGFNALVAARRMGAEAVSLSPIGEGPYSSLIQAALTREGITDLGPSVAGIDNGFCIAFTDHTGERTFISTKGAETMAPASAWADVVRTMRPGDVLYVDGYLMDHPANREAAQAALRTLPEGVRVVLDVSPVIGIPDGLPTRDVIISMNHREAQEIGERTADQSLLDRCAQPLGAAEAVCAAMRRPVVVRAGAQGAYFLRPSVAATNARDEDATHVPTPRVDAIDTNGAGDAHSGVLAASLAQGIPLERALLLANCAGALSATVVGPASCPMREEIEAAADALEARAGEE